MCTVVVWVFVFLNRFSGRVGRKYYLNTNLVSLELFFLLSPSLSFFTLFLLFFQRTRDDLSKSWAQVADLQKQLAATERVLKVKHRALKIKKRRPLSISGKPLLYLPRVVFPLRFCVYVCMCIY